VLFVLGVYLLWLCVCELDGGCLFSVFFWGFFNVGCCDGGGSVVVYMLVSFWIVVYVGKLCVFGGVLWVG
jgi:hypothetical protein